MTEQEWLACTDPTTMLEWLQANHLITDRKQRLLDCACVRRVWHLLTDERGRKAVEVAERFADGMAELDELREAQAAALAAADARATLSLPGTTNSYSVLSAAAGAAWEFRSGSDPLGHAAEATDWEWIAGLESPQRRLSSSRRAHERQVQATYVRDVIGNPFREVRADPRWLTDSTLSVADSVYSDRTFDHLPVLADLLDKAGCTDAYLVAHFWLPGPHVRGCWALDVILGKE